MEPQGPPLSPGTSHGSDSRPLDLAQDLATPTSPNCTLQPSYSPSVSDGLMSGKDSGNVEDESSKQVQASQSTAGADRRAHRRFSSSAFASSLSWDSDSEREALDEEDLQHFSNPHGLAAHSPGSPSSGHRHESEEAQNPEKVQCLHINTESLVPLEATSADNENAKTQEPNTSQADSTELPEDKVWNVSEEAKTFLAKIKPKDGCQMEEGPDASESVKQLERDVYSFPGDSDPESPPDSSPWARSTSSSQRCRKSRVLLRPFCGLGSSAQTAEAECQATSKPTESAVRSEDQGSCEFESLREGAAEEAEDDGQSEQEAEREIFTCVECSIYFKKQSHLQEHIMEHCESSAEGGETSVRGGSYRCVECGWGLPNQPALEEHLRRHQESRLKILQEIKKLNASGRAGEQRSISGLETAVALDGSAALTSEKEAEHSFDAPPSLSPARGSSEGAESMATDSDKASGSVRCPAQVRGGASNRRRFWCTKCTFTTRTSQALANHAKTHNRKKNVLPKNESNSPRSPSSSRSTSASLACFHCAFRTSSQALMREHQKLLHPGHFFISGWPANEIGPPSKSRLSKPNRDSELPCGSGSGSVSRSKTTLDQRQHGAPACEESGIPDCVTALPVGQVFKSSASRKFSVRRKSWSRLDKDNLLGILEHHEVLSPELDSESSQKEAESPVGPEAGPHETADDWPEEESAKSLLTPKRTVDNKDKSTSSKKDRKVFFLRSRNRSAAGAVELDGDDNDDDADEDDLQHFLTESLLDGDAEDAQDDAEAFKSMEKKCPYCPDRFHNGIGLANHVRGHLNRVGVSYNVRHFISPKEVNEIERKFSYQKKKKKARHLKCEGNASSPFGEPCGVQSTLPPLPAKDEYLEEDMDVDRKPSPIPPTLLALSSPSTSPGASPTATTPPHPGSPLSVVRKAPISSLLPVSSPLRSQEHKVGLVKGSAPNHSQAPGAIATSKPLWAPQENDAPLNLTLEVDPNKDIVCQLCGAWFETRKGLSSHARAHLRHFGVEYSESKGSPIDLLDQLVSTDDFKHKASEMLSDGHLQLQQQQQLSPSLLNLSKASCSSPSPASLIYTVTKAASKATSSTTTSSGLGPPPKRHKSSSMRVFRLSSGELMALHNEPPKEIGCEFCGEYFENRKGLSSHARSHLRQMGITEWSVNGSPIDTLREVITRRGLPCALPRKPLKSPPPSSPGPPPRSPLPASSSSSPSSALLGRPPFAFVHPSSPPPPAPPPTQLASSKSSSAPLASSGGGLILKLKPEPAQLEVTAPGTVGRAEEFPGDTISWANADSIFPLNLAIAHEPEPTRDIRCEFCGEYFENRKGLSSHARSHLRQMGITEWSVNGSPIDTLREVMHKRGLEPSSDQGVKKESSQDPGSPSWEGAGEPGGVEGGGVAGFQTSKFSKVPLGLLQSGSRIHKQGLTSLTAHAVSSAGRFFRISPLGKRPQQFDEVRSRGSERSPPPRQQPRTFSPQLHDFSFKRKASPDKHGHRDPSCELCGFFFENRKALASHARAHLRQFGVTEWSVNGSPIETLSAWMRSRPQKVLEMHRSYMQGNRSSLKKKDSPSTLSTTSSSSSSSSRWSSSLALSLVRPHSRALIHGSSSSKSGQGDTGTHLASPPAKPRCRSPSLSRLVVAAGGGGGAGGRGGGGGGGDGHLPLQAQVARSELNVRLPRGFERRPLKHPSCPDGAERDSGPPKPARTGTIPALVPKPPAAPLVKLVGKFYTLKCRFCEVQFHGPLSVQEDWIRHLQQHILKMNFSKAAAPPPPGAEDPAPSGEGAAQASTSTSSSVPAAAAAVPSAPCSSPSAPAERPLSAKVSEASLAAVALCTQTL